jgi:hypothetical protein
MAKQTTQGDYEDEQEEEDERRKRLGPLLRALASAVSRLLK